MYGLFAVAMLAALAGISASYSATLAAPAGVLADGTDPIPPPYPLAIPGKVGPLQIADGTDPVPPPYPLAVPGKLAPLQLADGTDPVPPPYPLAVPERLTSA
ncbi:MAG: hypothetical protein C5B51_16895 [Terriglobia bacterium]|nr:MAG: hypothetical protein C5B51_16895 [Terriglobia bacterium]